MRLMRLLFTLSILMLISLTFSGCVMTHTLEQPQTQENSPQPELNEEVQVIDNSRDVESFHDEEMAQTPHVEPLIVSEKVQEYVFDKPEERATVPINLSSVEDSQQTSSITTQEEVSTSLQSDTFEYIDSHIYDPITDEKSSLSLTNYSPASDEVTIPDEEADLNSKETPMFLRILPYLVIAIATVIIILLVSENKKVKASEAHERFRISRLGISNIESADAKKQELEETIKKYEAEWISLKLVRNKISSEISGLEEQHNKLEKRIESQARKLSRTRELISTIEHAFQQFFDTDIPPTYYRALTESERLDLDSIAPSVMLNLQYMSYQDLRKEFRANQKRIDELLEGYAQRYTTKANQAIYQLTVISLRSELQNILYNLKYEKLADALQQVHTLIVKYLSIASEGNQSIAGTMRKFVGQLEHLFESAVKIEYEYYIKREQARQEQLALRQQMREEAEERKRLEEQKKQIEFEESKYHAEIQKVQELLSIEAEDSLKRSEYVLKLEELNGHLAQVEEKKEEITRLQLGKAGNVYIISNLGSFGDHVFKVGMTRRLDPQDRVNELGGASVPFRFDVHSFIFSEDAVGLENELHKRLHSRRVNKVNLRKEFFNISLDELEELVAEINPTAEFKRTMVAEDYTQTLSMGDEVIAPVDIPDFDDEEFEAV